MGVEVSPRQWALPAPEVGPIGGEPPPGTRPDLDGPADPTGPTVRFATIPGPGSVRATAVGYGAGGRLVAVVVDVGDEPGRLVLLDGDGDVVADYLLRVGDQDYARPGGVAFTGTGVVVSVAEPPAVLAVDLSREQVELVADLPDVPLCLPLVRASDCQAAMPDGPPRPRHLTVGKGGDIYVADPGQGCLFRIARGATRASTWLCDRDLAATPLDPEGGVTGIAAATDRLVLTVAAGLDGNDRVYEVTVDGDEVGHRRQLAELEAAGASGVIVLQDGRIVVAMTKASRLAIVEEDGFVRTVLLDGVEGPVDLDSIEGHLLIAHSVEGAAGGLSTLAVP
jgi:hypothetical protein